MLHLNCERFCELFQGETCFRHVCHFFLELSGKKVSLSCLKLCLLETQVVLILVSFVFSNGDCDYDRI